MISFRHLKSILNDFNIFLNWHVIITTGNAIDGATIKATNMLVIDLIFW